MKTVTVIALSCLLLIGSVLVSHGLALVPYPADRDDGNDTPETATSVTMPHEGDYEIEPVGDIDWYKMELSAGTFLLLYTERINDSELDPRAIFYGPHSETGEDVDPSSWIANDDDGHGDLQPEIRISIGETGFYYLRISYYQDYPTGFGPNAKGDQRADTGEYRLFVQDLPDQPDINVDPTYLEFGLNEDQTQTNILNVENGGNLLLNVTSITNVEPWLIVDPTIFSVPVDSTVTVSVTANSAGLAEGTYTDTISIASDDPDESLIKIPVLLTVAAADGNDSPETATAIDVPHIGDYAIGTVGDVDWFRMYLDAGLTWTIYTLRIDDSQLDPRAILYGPHSETGEDVDSTNWIANDDDSHGNLQPEIQITITEAGYYFLRISYYANPPTAGREGAEKEVQRASTGPYQLLITSGAHGDAPQPDATFHLTALPNPAEDHLQFGILLPAEAQVRIGIYDLSGRLVLVPLHERLTSGYHTRVCDTHGLSPGAYVARLRAGDQTATQRMLISR